MSQDISELLAGWEYDPHELNVRLIDGEDGEPRIQMRLELGILQMFLNARPDGRRPYDSESFLDFHEARAKADAEPYRLSANDLEELYREGQQYYKRYLSLFHLEWYELVVRDTDRNLRLFAFVKKHARRRRDQQRFDQYRPYVLMMNARARGMLALREGDRDAALAAIDAAIDRVREFLDEYGYAVDSAECFELDFLKRWSEEVRNQQSKAPGEPEPTKLPVLRQQLEQAVAKEDYERAARLRDRIRDLESARGST